MSSSRHVVDAAHTAADGQRDEHLVGGPRHRVEQDLAGVGGRGDVEEDDLVGALAVVGRRQLGRVAGVAQVLEPNALDHAAVRRRRGTG